MSSLAYDFGFDMSFMGVKPDAFGSVMVTNVGSFGIPHALVPLSPTTRVPSLFAIGAIHDRALVVDGKVKVCPSSIVTASYDHRVYDGYQIAKMTAMVVDVTENPEAYDLMNLGTGESKATPITKARKKKKSSGS